METLVRLFSDYKFFPAGGNKSPDDFHKKAEIAIEKMNECLYRRTVRSCIYDRNLTAHSMPVSYCNIITSSAWFGMGQIYHRTL